MAISLSILADTAEPEVGRPGVNALTGLFGLLMIVGIFTGLYGFFVGHEHVYNNTREVPWGLLISTYAFFAITSTGLCLLAAISHVFGGNKIAPLANRMVWLSLITIISGFVVIGMEIENPWRMAIWNVISPNPTSNIWWMGTLYGMAVGFVILEFWLILTKQYKLALVLGFLVPLLKLLLTPVLEAFLLLFPVILSGTAELSLYIFWHVPFCPVLQPQFFLLIMLMPFVGKRWKSECLTVSRLLPKCRCLC
jgi:molybdopterin-containing oxidoreductase family membrane subunit